MLEVAALTALTVQPNETVPRVSSLKIAEAFGKNHKDVLRNIQSLTSDLPSEFRERNFAPTSIDLPVPNGAHRKSPAYLLTRDAFCLLVMGFTGERALAWKVRYLEAFNEMERRLAEGAAPPAAPPAPPQVESGRFIRKAGLVLEFRDLIQEGFKLAARLDPERRREIRRLVHYRKLGLSFVDSAKVLGCSKSKIRDLWADAVLLGEAPTRVFPVHPAPPAPAVPARKGGPK